MCKSVSCPALFPKPQSPMFLANSIFSIWLWNQWLSLKPAPADGSLWGHCDDGPGPCFWFWYHPLCLCSVTLLCPTLCDPVDCSPLGFSVHGISQARILEWVAIFFSRASSWPRDWTHISSGSCIGRWILYHGATWEVWYNPHDCSISLQYVATKRKDVGREEGRMEGHERETAEQKVNRTHEATEIIK